MPDMIYRFDEIQLVEGAASWASGECDICHDPFAFSIKQIRLDPDDTSRRSGGSPVIVGIGHPLFDALYRAIRKKHEDIWALIAETQEDLAVSYADTRADHWRDMRRG